MIPAKISEDQDAKAEDRSLRDSFGGSHLRWRPGSIGAPWDLCHAFLGEQQIPMFCGMFFAKMFAAHGATHGINFKILPFLIHIYFIILMFSSFH